MTVKQTLLKSSKYCLITGILSAVGAITFAQSNSESTLIHADIWADNWFTLYVDGTLIKEDSVSITTERSFNAESFNFEVQLPAQLSFIVKDFKQNDTGLEYIGSRKQQMGDGGLIAQFNEAVSGSTLLVSNGQWRCLPIQIAPLNKQCEKSSNPESSCGSKTIAEPNGWKSSAFNDSHWPQAIEFSEQTVRPKDGYDRVSWDIKAKLIWSSDLETDNTLLCRVTLEGI